MTGERQEHPNAEHGERLLTALDHRLEDWPFQPAPVLRYNLRRKHCHDDEVHTAMRREIGLVMRIERGTQPCREYCSELRDPSGQGHRQREAQVSDPEI